MPNFKCVIDCVDARTRFAEIETLQSEFPFAEWVISRGTSLTGPGAATIGDWRFQGKVSGVPLTLKITDYEVVAYARGDASIHRIAEGFSKIQLVPHHRFPVDLDRLASQIAREQRPVITSAQLFAAGPVSVHHHILLEPLPAELSNPAVYPVPPAAFAGRWGFATAHHHRDPLALLAAAHAAGPVPRGAWLQVSHGVSSTFHLDAAKVRDMLKKVALAQEQYPALASRAKAYYEELRRPAVISGSHIRLQRLHSDFGEAATAAALETYFQTERDEAALRNWEAVQKYYHKAGALPAEDHPERLAAEQVLEKRRSRSAEIEGPKC